jgi:hypothetical protein
MLLLRDRIRWVTAGALALMVSACSTDPVAPPAHAAPDVSTALQPSLGTADNLATTSLQAVKYAGRLRPSNHDVVVRQVIGTAGGTIHMRAQGLTLIVPPGAVSSPTTFQVKALAGRAVAYEFEPHGIRFKVPLIFRQAVTATSVGWGQSVQGGYFQERGHIDAKAGKAKVTEVLPATIKAGAIEFLIEHFSGYLVSCA